MSNKTATETLMAAMQEFGQAEPRDCLIIWTDEAEDVKWSCTSESSIVRLGMLEFVKSIMVRRIE